MTAIVASEFMALPKPKRRLAYYLESFYRWICSLSEDFGFCFRTNKWLAQHQDRDESTISARINALIEAGYFEVEHVPGVERRLYPLVSPLHPKARGKRSAWQKLKARVKALAGAGAGTSVQSAQQDPSSAEEFKTIGSAGPGAAGVAESGGNEQQANRQTLEGYAEGTPTPEAPLPYKFTYKVNDNRTERVAPVPPAEVAGGIQKADAAPVAAAAAVVQALKKCGLDDDTVSDFIRKYSEQTLWDAVDSVRYYQTKGEVPSPGGLVRRFAENFHAKTWQLSTAVIVRREEERKEREATAFKTAWLDLQKQLSAERQLADMLRKAKQAEAKQAEQERKQQEREAVTPEALREPWACVLSALEAKAEEADKEARSARGVPDSRPVKANHIGRAALEAHVKNLIPVDLEDLDGMPPLFVTLAAPSDFTRSWIEDRLGLPLREQLSWALMRDKEEVQIRVVVWQPGKHSREDLQKQLEAERERRRLLPLQQPLQQPAPRAQEAPQKPGNGSPGDFGGSGDPAGGRAP